MDITPERLDGLALTTDAPTVTIVVPVHNEMAAVPVFLDRISTVLGADTSFDVVFINDGSRDATERVIESHMTGNVPITLVNLSRNFGKEAALAAGLATAKGQVVVPMDVDLQDPPELLPKMIEKWQAGAKIVNARRIDRSQDTLAKRASAKGFYHVFNWLAEHPIPTDVGDYRLLDREVVEAVLNIGERSRFNKGIFSWVGFETDEVTYERPARSDGESQWSWWRLWKLALDGIFSSSTTPLRIWTYVGVTMAALSFIYGASVFLTTLIGGREVPGYASTVILILIFGGFNMIALGIIGEYVGRIYTEVRQRPLYIIRSIKGEE